MESRCREDMLDGNWQRQILKNLEEKHHRGVLTGSEITDMRLILIAGRSHEKHTEGGDFREAAWRAVRQGLMSAESILLEPVYQFRLDLPAENLGRAMSDLQRMGGNMEPPENHGSQAVLKGTVPAACLVDYQEELREYTRGQGRLTCTLRGYEPCRNPQEVIEAIGYDPDRDLDNPSASVFCSHGAGTLVPWDQVRDHMHVDSGWRSREEGQETEPDSPGIRAGAGKRSGTGDSGGFLEGELREQELREIFERTYGPIRKKEGAADPGLTSGIPGWKRSGSRRKEAAETGISDRRVAKQRKPGREYLLVDGYNIIFAWEELKKLAEKNMDAARDKLMDILSNFQGYRPCTLILVFDAYKVPGGPGEVMKYHNIYVVYTKEAETADQYIEKNSPPDRTEAFRHRGHLRRPGTGDYPGGGSCAAVRGGTAGGSKGGGTGDPQGISRPEEQPGKLSFRRGRGGTGGNPGDPAAEKRRRRLNPREIYWRNPGASF